MVALEHGISRLIGGISALSGISTCQIWEQRNRDRPMPIQGILREIVDRPVTADPDWTVGKITDVMLDEDVSTILIVDQHGRMIGLVTESALLAAAVDPPRQAEAISLYMERKFASVNSRASLDDVVQTFIDRRVRHLPVIEKGCPVGIISRRRLLQELTGRQEEMTESMAGDSVG